MIEGRRGIVGSCMIGEAFESVVEGARAGDERAFAALYRELNSRLLRYFAARAASAAEDLAAETWLAVAKGIRTFEGGERDFRAWFFTIAHRRLVQHRRDAGRRPSTPVSAGLFVTRPAPDSPESEVVALGDAAAAARLLSDSLPPDQATVVLLRVLGDLSVEEVAGVLGKRRGTVRVLQHRALRRLAREFSAEPVTLRTPHAM